MSTHRRQTDIKRVAKILRDGNYTYDQSKDLIKSARKLVGLTPSKRRRGSVDRLTQDEFQAFLNTAYSRSGGQEPEPGHLFRQLSTKPFHIFKLPLQPLEVHVRSQGQPQSMIGLPH